MLADVSFNMPERQNIFPSYFFPQSFLPPECQCGVMAGLVMWPAGAAGRCLVSADPRPLIGQMRQYWPLIGCRSGVRPTADLLLSSSLPSIDLSSRQVASKACPAPCTARPGTRRGTQGAVGRHTARRTQSPCQENIQSLGNQNCRLFFATLRA